MCVELEKAEIADLSSRTFDCRTTCNQHRQRGKPTGRQSRGICGILDFNGWCSLLNVAMVYCVPSNIIKHVNHPAKIQWFSQQAKLFMAISGFPSLCIPNLTLYVAFVSSFYSHHPDFTPTSPRVGALAVFDTQKITACITLLATEVRERLR